MDYDNNILMRRTNTQKLPVHKNELSKILNLSQSAVKVFWKEVNPYYLKENEDGTLVTNPDVFMRGKIKKRKDEYISLQKFFNRGVRAVYEATEPSKHRHLGYIYSMLPYINIEYNVLCDNPLEQDKDRIKPLTMGEFCDLIGFDRSHADRLSKIYNKLKFKVNDHEELFCIPVKYKMNVGMFVNPRILYNGSNPDKIRTFNN